MVEAMLLNREVEKNVKYLRLTREEAFIQFESDYENYVGLGGFRTRQQIMAKEVKLFCMRRFTPKLYDDEDFMKLDGDVLVQQIRDYFNIKDMTTYYDLEKLHIKPSYTYDTNKLDDYKRLFISELDKHPEY
mmetsp:Transcript_11563/g.11580  ORF Transcript_11563/g.11580 Transcript_11563/m.11580 type:complete len:132 (+) Transcript_11563:331-726(+)